MVLEGSSGLASGLLGLLPDLHESFYTCALLLLDRRGGDFSSQTLDWRLSLEVGEWSLTSYLRDDSSLRDMVDNWVQVVPEGYFHMLCVVLVAQNGQIVFYMIYLNEAI